MRPTPGSHGWIAPVQQGSADVLTAVLTPIVAISCKEINESIQPIHRKRKSNYRPLSLIIAPFSAPFDPSGCAVESSADLRWVSPFKTHERVERWAACPAG